MSGVRWGATIRCAVCGESAQTNSLALIEGTERYVCWQCDDPYDHWGDEPEEYAECPNCGAEGPIGGACGECYGEIGS